MCVEVCLIQLQGSIIHDKNCPWGQGILENMLQNHNNWHTNRVPTSAKNTTGKIDSLIAMLIKPNTGNVRLIDLVDNNNKNIDVNSIEILSTMIMGTTLLICYTILCP